MTFQNTRYGLLGRGLAASLSKTIHEKAMEVLGIEGGYGIFDIPDEERCIRFLSDFFAQGGLGLNVTAPYKYLPMQLREHRSSPVNTVTPFSLHSTDPLGLSEALKCKSFSWEEFRHVVFIGSGATVQSLLEFWNNQSLNFLSVRILSRSKPNPHLKEFLLGNAMGHRQFEVLPLRPVVLATLADEACEQTIFINAASAVMGGDDFSDLISCFDQFKGVYQELTYGQARTKLFYALRTKNSSRTLDGLQMLVEQAREAQRIWWGKTVDASILMEACSEVLAREEGK